MLEKFYYWLHRITSKTEERGEISSGYWMNISRTKVLNLCEFLDGKLLEVGCGEGLFLNKLAQKNKKLAIFGIDICREIILKARDRFQVNKTKNINLTQADSCNIPFRDNFFETVVCVNTLYNLPTDKIFYISLKEIIRVCKRGGRIIFDIRNKQNPFLYFKYRFAGVYDKTVKHPLRTHSLNKVILFLKKHNAEIIKIINIGFPRNIFSPIFIIEAERR